MDTARLQTTSLALVFWMCSNLANTMVKGEKTRFFNSPTGPSIFSPEKTLENVDFIQCVAINQIKDYLSVYWNKTAKSCHMTSESLLNLYVDYDGESEMYYGTSERSYDFINSSKYALMYIHDDLATAYPLRLANINIGEAVLDKGFDAGLSDDLNINMGHRGGRFVAHLLSNVYHVCIPSWVRTISAEEMTRADDSLGTCIFMEPGSKVWQHVTVFDNPRQSFPSVFKVNETTLWIAGGRDGEPYNISVGDSLRRPNYKTSKFYVYDPSGPYVVDGPDLPNEQYLHEIGWLNDTHILMVGRYVQGLAKITSWPPTGPWRRFPLPPGHSFKIRFPPSLSHVQWEGRTQVMMMGSSTHTQSVYFLDPITLEWALGPEAMQTVSDGRLIYMRGNRMLVHNGDNAPVTYFDGIRWHPILRNTPFDAVPSTMILVEKAFYFP